MAGRTLLRALTALLAGAVCGCAPSTSPGSATPAPAAVVYPAPPDSPRIQFLAGFSSAEELGSTPPSLLDRLLGRDRATAGGVILKPYGIASAGDRVVICDTRLPGVHTLSLPDRALRTERVEDGGLVTPIHCTPDPAGRAIFVADPGLGQVVVLEDDGRVSGRPGGRGGRPTDVAVAGDTLWIADVATHQVRAVDRSSGRLLLTLPRDSAGHGRLYSPTNLAVHGDRVYVTDTGDFRVKIYRKDGRFLRAVGEMGRLPGQFMRPKGLAVDPDGRLYVVDAAFENVQLFDPSGRLLLSFGGPGQGPGDLWLPAAIALHHDTRPFASSAPTGYRIEYLVLVTSQFGSARINVYGFLAPDPGA